MKNLITNLRFKNEFIMLAVSALCIVLLVVYSQKVFSSDPSTANLELYYDFDHIVDQTLYDQSGNNRDGNIFGGGLAAGQICQGFYFGGEQNDFVSTSGFNVSGGLTLSAWINLEEFGSGNDQDIVVRKGQLFYDTNRVWLLQITDGKIEFIAKDTGSDSLNGNTTLSPNTWYHVVGTYDGSTLKVYLNGVLDGSKTSHTGIGSNSEDIVIGGKGATIDNTKGIIDEVRVYSRALSQAEVQELHNYGPEVTCPSAANYSFDASPLSVSFEAERNGPLPSPHNIQITNSGNQTLNLGVSEDVPAVSINQTSIPNLAPGATATITVTADDTNLDPGQVTGQISLVSTQNNKWILPNGDWIYRKLITIDHNKVSGSSNLDNFPMLLSVFDADLRDVNNGGKVAQADGGDILFTADDGQTKLSYEIEKYDPVLGQLIAWVKIPTLLSATNTPIYLYYGNADTPNQQNPTSTWNSDFKMVYHLPDGLSLSANDSTSNNYDGTISPTINATAGIVMDGGADFVSGSGRKIDTGHVLLPTSSGTDPFSISAWVKLTDVSTTRTIFTQYISSNSLRVNGYIDTSGKVAYQKNGNIRITSTLAVNDGYWHKVVFTKNSSSLVTLYIDGIPQGTYTDTTAYANTNTQFGGVSGTAVYLGQMDELTVLSTNSSADWVKTEYNNQSNPSAFYTYGTEEVDDSGVINIPVTYTITESEPVTQNSLTVIVSGPGVVISTPSGISCNSTCSANFDEFTEVNLSVVPSTGKIFLGWTGNCTGRGACNLIMNSPKTVYATFSADPAYKEF